MTFSGSFTTASPLPADTNSSAFGPDLLNLLAEWHISDGITTFTSANSLLDASYFDADTDVNGIITTLEFGFTTPSGPIADGDQVNQIFFQYQVDDPPRYRARAFYQRTCETANGGLCDTFEAQASNEAYIETTGSITITPTPTAVPVMPLWLLGLTTLAIAGAASVRIRRER